MPNRLAESASPYLRQHAENPVDWYEWGEEAFQRARDLERPIFLSVGYSSCHWCHVMAHESFENEAVAAILNDHFVSIKLDREERPDVDDVYMTAVQLATGRGGWPMTIFMLPDGKPFFAGTYFPREDRGPYPGFLTLLRQVAQAWHDHRSQLFEAAREFSIGLADSMHRLPESDGGLLGLETLANALDVLHGEFDPDHGGFGGAPKFPPHTALSFLLRLASSPVAEALDTISPGAVELARSMALTTLDKMALGGIHDHAGGGFHRYSTDDHWLLPHFEKMLYDNAQLLAAYASVEDLRCDRIAQGIVSFLTSELMGSSGVLYSALDADSEGEEGLYYTWTLQEIRNVLGFDATFEAEFGVTSDGNFEDEAHHVRTGRNILSRKNWNGDFGVQLEKLRLARSVRTRPGLDDKAIAAWNGMAIQGLVHVDRELAEQVGLRWAQCARLPHMIARNEEIGEAFLDDIAHMGLAFHALGWHERAAHLADRMLAEFRDVDGAFWYTSSHHETLIGRAKPVLDQSMPSGNGAAARLLVELGRYDDAERAFVAVQGWMERAPNATESLLEALLIWMERTKREISKGNEVRIALDPEIATPDANGMVHSSVHLSIPPNMHIGGAMGAPLKCESDTPAQFSIPDGELRGEVVIPFSLTSDNSRVRVAITFQICTDAVCFESQTKELLLSIIV